MTAAKEIMVSDVLSIGADTPIYLAIGLLVEKGISGLPIVDDDDVLAGIITEKDMLKLVDNDELADSQTVADYMVHDVRTFNLDDDVMTIKNFLIEHPFRRVPIVDGEGKLAGIVSRRDIIAFYLTRRSEVKDLLAGDDMLENGDEGSGDV